MCREDALPYGSAATRLPRRPSAPEAVRDRRRAIGSAGERLVHTEEVTGSIPVSPTDVTPAQRTYEQLSSYAEDGSFCRIGRNLGDRVLRLVAERRAQMVEERNGECGRPVCRSLDNWQRSSMVLWVTAFPSRRSLTAGCGQPALPWLR